MSAKNSKNISIVVSPRDAEDILRGNFHHIGNKLIKKIRGEFVSVVENTAEEVKARTIYNKLKTSPTYDTWKIDYDNSNKPFRDAIDAAHEALQENYRRQTAILDRIINQAFRKAGITEFYSLRGYLDWKQPSNITNHWEYGNGNHWEGNDARSWSAEIEAANKTPLTGIPADFNKSPNALWEAVR